MVVLVLEVAVQLVRTVDKRLHPAQALKKRRLRQDQLEWVVSGENKDYLATDYLTISQVEATELLESARLSHEMLLDAVTYVHKHQLWANVGIPEQCIPLVAYSLEHEWDNHLVGRFDFAGGLDGLPTRLLEYNADTSSLLPETALLQEILTESSRSRPHNDLMASLERRFRQLLANYPDREPYLLVSSMGHPEDFSNVDTVARAARVAGFELVFNVDLEAVIFDPEEGLFVETEPETFVRVDFWFKMIPWDFIAFEEPELWELLDTIIQNGQCIVLNPAWAMILQSKGLLAIVDTLYPDHSLLLAARLQELDIQRQGTPWVRKPFFGRMGENVSLFDASGRPVAENDGVYADQPMVYQEAAPFNEDTEAYRYQASVFYVGEPAAIAFRRQDDLLIDDDAEYIAHVVN